MIQHADALASTQFDVLVIGGGVLGACVARDAALRGLQVALVDRGDWGSETSANGLRIVHGGLRYLQHANIRRVRESIRERSTWLRIAPHLVAPLPVLVPTHGLGVRSRIALRTALVVNDAMSRDRNRGVAPDREIPSGRVLSRAECLSLVPEFEARNPSGAILFHDALMYSSERLVLETVMGAIDGGAVAANYVEAIGPLRHSGRLAGVVARERNAGGAMFDIRARYVVNCAGAVAPSLAATLLGRDQSRRFPIVYTLAMNLGVESTGHTVAFAMSGGPRARQLFVVPWRGQTLVGTAHVPYSGDLNVFEPPETEVEAFLSEVNAAWPSRAWTRADVRFVQAGLVPGRANAAARTAQPDRHRWLVDHALDGEPSLVTVASVKYTTARRVAEEAVDAVCGRLGGVAGPCRTADTPLPGTPEGTVDALLRDARRAHPGVAPPVLEHLVRSHGRRYADVIRVADADPTWLDPIVEGTPVVYAQFVHAARAEMARTADDIIRRRTELGAVGRDTPAAWSLAEKALSDGRRK